METLFLERPVFEKVASGKKISDKPGQWVKEVMTYFHDEYPQLAQLPVDVNFTQQDPEKGTAIGSLIIRDWKVTLPIIIHENVLNPLDVAVYEGRILPFNEETLDSLFNQRSAFSNVVADDSTERLRRVFGRDLESIEKISEVSLIDGLNGLISEGMKEKVAEMASKWNFGEAGRELLEKIAKLEVIEETKGDIEPDFYLLEKTGKWDYKARLGNVGLDNTRIIEVDGRNLASFKSEMEKIGAKVGRSGDFGVEKTSEIEFEVPIVGFDGSETGLLLSADADKNYTLSKEAGIVTQENPDKSFTLKLMPETRKPAIKLPSGNGMAKISPDTGAIKTAEYGSFILENGLSKPLSLEKVSEYGKSVEIDAFDGLEIVKIAMIPGIDEGIKSEDEEFDYYLPLGCEFVKLGSYRESLENLDEYSNATHTVMVKDGTYSFFGEEFDKYAELGHPTDSLSGVDAVWTFISMGGTNEELVKMSELEENYIIQGKMTCPKPFEGIEVESNPFEDIDLTKEAASMEHAGTVDALLSLNFLSKENLGYFIEQLPTFENILGTLAHLLLNTRLGLKEVSEEATEKAMHSMSTVVNKLYELKAVLSKKKKDK